MPTKKQKYPVYFTPSLVPPKPAKRTDLPTPRSKERKDYNVYEHYPLELFANISDLEYQARLENNLEFLQRQMDMREGFEHRGWYFTNQIPLEENVWDSDTNMNDVIAATFAGSVPIKQDTGQDAIILLDGNKRYLECKLSRIQSSRVIKKPNQQGDMALYYARKPKFPGDKYATALLEGAFAANYGLGKWQPDAWDEEENDWAMTITQLLRNEKTYKSKLVHTAYVLFDCSLGIFVDAWLVTPEKMEEILHKKFYNPERTSASVPVSIKEFRQHGTQISDQFPCFGFDNWLNLLKVSAGVNPK